MKKLTSFVLLLTFLFHAGGFYVMFWVLRHQASVEIIQRVEKEGYTAEETITLKIPLAIPYNNDSQDYQQIEGEIEHNGEFLRLIKQKFVRDTLYVVCVRDNRQKELVTAMTDFVKVANDLPTSSPAAKILGNSLREFTIVHPIESNTSLPQLFSFSFDERPYEVLNQSRSVESPPPDL